jgi:hypothetical protein
MFFLMFIMLILKVWLEAALMACYTLGPGWGTIPLIGSHNKFHGNTIKLVWFFM